ncbi:hypothetical protein [Catenulispora subtropica]|uniref:Uncharacterized protein n=1 Tax=Catenulispora subtropica TaxID=450798 RepID=A0ABN2T8Y8_9ACTN
MTGQNLACELPAAHLVEGGTTPGRESAPRVDPIGVGGLTMPRVWGVRPTGRLPEWASAEDVILEMPRRHGVKGGLHRIAEHSKNAPPPSRRPEEVTR